MTAGVEPGDRRRGARLRAPLLLVVTAAMIAVSAATPTKSRAEHFESAPNGFSFDLPDGWRRLSHAAIEDLVGAAATPEASDYRARILDALRRGRISAFAAPDAGNAGFPDNLTIEVIDAPLQNARRTLALAVPRLEAEVRTLFPDYAVVSPVDFITVDDEDGARFESTFTSALGVRIHQTTVLIPAGPRSFRITLVTPAPLRESRSAALDTVLRTFDGAKKPPPGKPGPVRAGLILMAVGFAVAVLGAMVELVRKRYSPRTRGARPNASADPAENEE